MEHHNGNLMAGGMMTEVLAGTAIASGVFLVFSAVLMVSINLLK